MKLLINMILISVVMCGVATAEPVPVQTPSSETDVKEALTGGVPMDRWKEGLLFDGVRPMPWLQSAANWFPGTEDVQPNEMRVTFMGTAPNIRPGQMNTSIYVELGNGDNFVFDMGKGL
jgi:ribonuclease Z